MQTCFIISAIIAVVGLLGALANLYYAATRELGEKVVGIYIVCSTCWILGALGCVVFGIIWAIQHFTA